MKNIVAVILNFILFVVSGTALADHPHPWQMDFQEAASPVMERIESLHDLLLRRGNAMSGAPIISGTNQFPKPPIIAGITIKNTMTNA